MLDDILSRYWLIILCSCLMTFYLAIVVSISYQNCFMKITNIREHAKVFRHCYMKWSSETSPSLLTNSFIIHCIAYKWNRFYFFLKKRNSVMLLAINSFIQSGMIWLVYNNTFVYFVSCFIRTKAGGCIMDSIWLYDNLK